MRTRSFSAVSKLAAVVSICPPQLDVYVSAAFASFGHQFGKLGCDEAVLMISVMLPSVINRRDAAFAVDCAILALQLQGAATWHEKPAS